MDARASPPTSNSIWLGVPFNILLKIYAQSGVKIPSLKMIISFRNLDNKLSFIESYGLSWYWVD